MLTDSRKVKYLYISKKKNNLRASKWVLKATCNDQCMKCTHHVDNLWGYHRSNSCWRVRPAIANISKCWWKMKESLKNWQKVEYFVCACVICVFFQREELESLASRIQGHESSYPRRKKGGREGVTNEIIGFLGGWDAFFWITSQQYKKKYIFSFPICSCIMKYYNDMLTRVWCNSTPVALSG